MLLNLWHAFDVCELVKGFSSADTKALHEDDLLSRNLNTVKVKEAALVLRMQSCVHNQVADMVPCHAVLATLFCLIACTS